MVPVRRRQDEYLRHRRHEGPVHGYYGSLSKRCVYIQNHRAKDGYDDSQHLDAGEAKADGDVMVPPALTRIH